MNQDRGAILSPSATGGEIRGFKVSHWPSFLVLLISVSVCLAATFAINQVVKARELDRFNRSTEQLQQTMQSGLSKHLTLLDSVRAFAVAKISMNSTQFHSYIEALDLRKNYRGIDGLGIAAIVSAKQKAELLQKAREQGMPNFRIWPESDQAEICPLVILEPRDAQTQANLGYDLFAIPEQRAIARGAAEIGDPAATATSLMDPKNAASKKGFKILVPIYKGGGQPDSVEERRTNIAGFVYCAFQTEDLLQTIVGRNTNSAIGLRIYDGPAARDGSLIFQSSNWSPSSKPARFSSASNVSVAGRTWTLAFASQPNFVSGINPAPITLLGGLVLSGLLWAITISQTRAREAAERHTLELRESEAKIRELNAGLEQRVTERTAELQAAVEELKAFSYTVSHDLRAPLRHIDGYVNLLHDNPNLAQDEKALRHTSIISKSAQHMGQLIDGLLNFARIGWMHLAVTPQVDVNEIVKDVCQMLTPETEKRVIQWHIADLPKVTADRTLLHQVFANLVSNAVKYSGPRSPAVIEIGSQDRGQEILFFVKDNGVGFDMNYSNKLFTVFQRLHTKEEFEGTGIGLANIKKIVSRHGGRAWAESIVGEGATFFFTLPKGR